MSCRVEGLVLYRLAKVVLEHGTFILVERADNDIAKADVVNCWDAATNAHHQPKPQVCEGPQHVPCHMGCIHEPMTQLGQASDSDVVLPDVTKRVNVVITSVLRSKLGVLFVEEFSSSDVLGRNCAYPPDSVVFRVRHDAAAVRPKDCSAHVQLVQSMSSFAGVRVGLFTL